MTELRERLIEAAMRADINPTNERDMDNNLGRWAAEEVVDGVLRALREVDFDLLLKVDGSLALSRAIQLGEVSVAFTAYIDAIAASPSPSGGEG